MASSLAMGGTLRHLRDLFGDGTAVGLGDAQLLARYNDSREEAHFAILVARHGPMVLATCRAVLKHEHDVEDAFQATFLILARKGRSVRGGDALGGWLHRVAYRASIRACRAARRRRHREAQAAAMTPLHSAPTDLATDVAAIVHEEVDRLPEKHRLPVVLCDLEGLTYEQAAGRLCWTVPTLRCRLAKARHQLHGRLDRRGITAGAVAGFLSAQAAAARAAVPADLARSTVAAAAGGAATATAAALSASLIRTMAMTRLKIASAGVLIAITLATAGIVAADAWRPDPAGLAMTPRAGASMKQHRAANEARPPASEQWIEVRGRVVDPRGRPVLGAAVRTYHPGQDDRPVPVTTTGLDGRFLLRVRPWRINSLVRSGVMYPWVVASAPGFGPGWASAVREPGAPDETTVRLEEDGPPIEARIVDLEGRPVAGAQVRVEHLWFARERSLSAWLEQARDSATEGPWRGLDKLPASIIATAGPDGRFRLTGIGRDRLAEVFVSGPTIATAQLYIANRDGTAIRTADPFDEMNRRPGITYYSRRFEYAAEPTRPIAGTIRDKDSDQPIAGLTLRGRVYGRSNLIPTPGVEAKTDARGHYRLDGLPVGPSYRLFIETGQGHPYTWATFVTPDGSPAFGTIAFDIALKRGVVVRGRVTDKATGRPVSGFVHAFAFADNPHADEFPGFRESQETNLRIGEDGRYEVTALPGRGLIACRSDVGRYRMGVGAATIQGYDPKFRDGGFHTLQRSCRSDNYHVLAEIHPDPKTEAVTLDLQVDPGRSLIIHAADPEGHPLGGTRASGLADLSSPFAYEQDSPVIEVRALDPSKPRRVTLTHEGRKLAGSVYLKGDEVGPLTVRLQPSGTVTGRIVDEEGRPRGGLVLNNLDVFDPQTLPDRAMLLEGDFNPGMVVGRDGRFRVEGLVPGLKYGAGARQGLVHLGEVFRDVNVATGEVKDLGDLKVIPSRGND